MATYEKFVKDIGISFSFHVHKDSKKLESRDLTGPEKLKLFQNINICSLLPLCPDSKKIETIWKDFLDIIGDLKLDFTSDESTSDLKSKIKSWFEKFLQVYQTKDVTPYMHALHFHIPEFLSLYQNVSYFTQQGMEKYNDRASKDYFRSTNHKGVDALKQLFQKKNRIQFLEATGCERVKLTYKCSNCSEPGHTIKTCTSKCKHCEVHAGLLCTSTKGKWQMEAKMPVWSCFSSLRSYHKLIIHAFVAYV